MKRAVRNAVGPVAVLSLAALSPFASEAPHSARSSDLAEELRRGASALGAAHRASPRAGELRFEFEDEERRFVDYFPQLATEKRGVALGFMNLAQRRATHSLLATALSREGYLEVQNIASLEDVLRHSGLDGLGRLSDDYTMQLFGEPEGDGPWAMKYEGHHVSVNMTVLEGEVRGTPLFLGANPVEVRQGPRAGQRAFAPQHELAFALLESLSAEQRVHAHSVAPPEREAIQRGLPSAAPRPRGLAGAAMDDAQRALLLDLIATCLRPLEASVAWDQMERVLEAGVDKLHFHWRGPTGAHERHAYRIQGPAIWIDYEVLQNPGEDDANHVHLLVRDPQRDFGMDLLQAHRLAHAGLEAKRARALADLAQLEQATLQFATLNGGRYPDSLEWLVTPDANGRTYLDRTSLPKDPWGTVYVYHPPGPGEKACSLLSLGADGLEGGEGADADIALSRASK